MRDFRRRKWTWFSAWTWRCPKRRAMSLRSSSAAGKYAFKVEINHLPPSSKHFSISWPLYTPADVVLVTAISAPWPAIPPFSNALADVMSVRRQTTIPCRESSISIKSNSIFIRTIRYDDGRRPYISMTYIIIRLIIRGYITNKSLNWKKKRERKRKQISLSLSLSVSVISPWGVAGKRSLITHHRTNENKSGLARWTTGGIVHFLLLVFNIYNKKEIITGTPPYGLSLYPPPSCFFFFFLPNHIKNNA